MPRPKKDVADRRDNRVTVYLSDSEHAALKDVAEREERSMTQVLTQALRDWLMRLLEPPESLRKARMEKIMEEQSLTVRGYMCSRGHVWWVDWIEPMDPRRCPMCGSQENLRKTWSGTVKRGI
ncbi:hypothetical protein [Alicyclobacillus sp. SO9]|uniref:hypothetical protein n=1 Tax=Alicyclobacillus sp. SO9 TaxID=2665646 RepID=UPI0018E88081|nr:hypothetical protein [Alicyclobacillus sp. SO9]QQE81547.1 hypothetical protein GI364_24925 [Alicyclobacillus sp. SO9]